MSPTPASKIFANGFLTGFLDVVSAMLSSSFSFEIESVEEVDDGTLGNALSQFTALVVSPVKSGGGFALLMNGSMANYIVAGVLGEKIVEGDSIEVHDKATLSEVFSPCMGGGVSHFKEKYGKVIELQQAVVEPNTAESLSKIRPLLGVSATMATFAVRGQDKEGRGVLLFSRALEDVIPAEQRGEPIPQRRGEKAVAGELEPEALDKLLHDLEPGAESEPLIESKRSRTGGDSSPRNIDMVLDIQLVATARLGKVEMPIGEILSLGPGSIIEVGHLVDEPVELLVNNKLIARGDVVVVDEKFGLRITEIVSPKERIESLR